MSQIAEKHYTTRTLDLTSKLLKQNPEYYSIWNHRRLVFRQLLEEALLTSQSQDVETAGDRPAELIRSDLAFLVPLLRKFPKCYWIWNYRLWLLQQAADKCFGSYSFPIWDEDLTLIGKMLSLDSRNFLAWGYRRTVVDGLDTIQSMNSILPKPRTEGEFEYTTKMINMNLSNFSAWHRRSKLIPRLLSERHADDDSRRQMLDAELDLIQRGLYAGDNDQSLWFYHQVLMCTFDPRYASQSLAPNLSNIERVEYLSKEIEKVIEMLDGAEDCKWIYQELINMTLLKKRLGGTGSEQDADVGTWLGELEKLDPLRARRWKDMRRDLVAGI